MSAHRRLLEEFFDSAVAAAHPRALVEEAVDRMYDHTGGPRRVGIIAVGKAAPAMAATAVGMLPRRGTMVTNGVVIGVDDEHHVHPAIRLFAGDHPVPGRRSAVAARAVREAVRNTRQNCDAALVMISGGATSLVGAPVRGITTATLATLYTALLRSGWDIHAMNTVRKRFLRWGAGRLAAALAPLPVHLAILSDVIGDDPGIIASGPCSPDATTAPEILERIEQLSTLDARTRATLADYLARVARGELPETPKPGHRFFARVATPVVRGNRSALAAIADHAERAGFTPRVAPAPLRGEAHERGAAIARELLRVPGDERVCIIHGGETTVTLSPHDDGLGGRCQELALSAAREIASTPEAAPSIALLAAGTDGRDGPTDAAGAIVDRDSWQHAVANGGDPDAALAGHDSHHALAAAGALLPARVTGTNVMDIVVGVVSAR